MVTAPPEVGTYRPERPTQPAGRDRLRVSRRLSKGGQRRASVASVLRGP